ncbi:hypothetical protein CEXT_535491 [Caerostris extrusa]|uniref:Uncharacterized protein n=1 Tax=Caerostris extrusa TaxID=172846 RepID=A0AAV4R686_CAEEX|nr:hypothetical protein CEXT_535491 [Caerostris extrusa]
MSATGHSKTLHKKAHALTNFNVPTNVQYECHWSFKTVHEKTHTLTNFNVQHKRHWLLQTAHQKLPNDLKFPLHIKDVQRALWVPFHTPKRYKKIFIPLPFLMSILMFDMLPQLKPALIALMGAVPMTTQQHWGPAMLDVQGDDRVPPFIPGPHCPSRGACRIVKAVGFHWAPLCHEPRVSSPCLSMKGLEISEAPYIFICCMPYINDLTAIGAMAAKPLGPFNMCRWLSGVADITSLITM